MIAIVHSIYSQSVYALALNARLMDNDAERYCSYTNVIWNMALKRLKIKLDINAPMLEQTK